MDGADVFINRLPVTTYNRLGMNESKITGAAIESEARILLTGFENSGKACAASADIRTGAGEELDELFIKSGISDRVFDIDKSVNEPLRMEVFFDKDLQGMSAVVNVHDNVNCDIVVELSKAEEIKAFGAFSLKLNIGRASHVRIIQLTNGDKDLTLVNTLGSRLFENAGLELIQISSKGKLYQSFMTELLGDGSEFTADIAYELCGHDLLDMNDVVMHKGRKTKSEINAGGSLADNSKKLFRGTIDLQKGCAGAVGNEKEEVLLLDDTVINQTIPLILCGEEDVVGNHGATIGRPDEDKLFYLESRGISEKAALELLIKASMNKTYKKLWDKKLRERLLGAESYE